MNVTIWIRTVTIQRSQSLPCLELDALILILFALILYECHNLKVDCLSMKEFSFAT